MPPLIGRLITLFTPAKITLTPAIVGLLSVFIYIGVALSLLKPLGIIDLVLVDSAKHQAMPL